MVFGIFNARGERVLQQDFSGHAGTADDHLTACDEEFLPIEMVGFVAEWCVFDGVPEELLGLREVDMSAIGR